MPQQYNKAVITNAGLALLNKTQAGTAAMRFTRMVTGCGTYAAEEKTPSALRERGALKSERNSYAISSIDVTSVAGVKLTALLTNQDPATGAALVTEGYYLNEIGLYAKEKDGDDDTEALYSVAVAVVENRDYMPAFVPGDGPTQIIQEYRTRVSDADSVTIGYAGAVMLEGSFDISAQTPTFEEAANRENIASGERLGVILGKVKKFFAGLHRVAFTGSYNDLKDKPDMPSSPPAEIAVDSALNSSSENPVQNKAIAARLAELSFEMTAAGEAQNAYTDKKVGDLLGAAPETLDTIEEVSNAIKENETVIAALNAAIGNKVDKVAGKGLSTNDFTTEEKNKLARIQTVNNAKLTIQRNGIRVQTFTANQATDATVNILVPTKISELENDAGFGSSPVTVDTEMSESSTNPVQNKVITAYINKLHGSALHGFEINQAEPDPDSMMSYIEDSVARSPAYMDYANDKFNYGGWESEWFIRNLKPCILNYSGTVAYELDKNNYKKRKSGTASDVANGNFAGNAMVGIPKVYWKISRISDDVAQIRFCDENMDGTFKCWSHLDNNGTEIPYCYIPIYDGSLVNERMRSLSGKEPTANLTAMQEAEYAKANNLTSDIIWYTEVFSDRMLIDLLLLLIGKSTNTQAVFGSGRNNTHTTVLESGTMDEKGLFYGSQNNESGVKVFGVEHFYGNISRRIAGIIFDGQIKTKMTYGTLDDSNVIGYNFDGAGYSVIEGTDMGSCNSYIKKMKFSEKGLFPIAGDGSSSTYYCDNLWSVAGKAGYLSFGGHSNYSLQSGAFCTEAGNGPDASGWAAGASISCKPLAPTGGDNA